jgi:hypothetical protein
MGTGDSDDGLTGMGRFPADRLEHERSAGDSLVVLVRIDQPGKERPPVVNQGHQATDDLAAVQIMGGEATPPPLIL